MNDIACEDDKILAAEVKEMNSRGHHVTDWTAGGSSKMWAGDDNASGVQSKGHDLQDSHCQITQMCTLEI